MAVKINNITVIEDSRKGQFQKMNPGVFSTPPTASVGDMIYDANEETIKVYTGSEWK